VAIQVHSTALNPLATVQLTGALLGDASFRATLKAALVAAPYAMTSAGADAILSRMKHADIDVKVGPIYMSDAGQTADDTCREYDTGSTREIRNCKLLLNSATIYAPGAYDLRCELYS
jgi:hypothetical protein